MTATQVTSNEGAGVPAGSYREQIDVLFRRLETGWQLIDQRTQAGESVEELERHWLRLLGEYEQLCAVAS